MMQLIRNNNFFYKKNWAQNRLGQTTIETAILLMVIVFAFLAMQTYLKRGMQGRLRGNIDQIGEQYDPQKTTSDYTTAHVSNSTTTTETGVQEEYVPSPTGWGGAYHNRLMTTVRAETQYDNSVRSGYEDVGAP